MSKMKYLTNRQCVQITRLEAEFARWVEEIPVTFATMTPEQIAPYLEEKAQDIQARAEQVTGYAMTYRVDARDPAYVLVQLYPADEQPVRVQIAPQYDYHSKAQKAAGTKGVLSAIPVIFPIEWR
jgi:hypothetical protein